MAITQNKVSDGTRYRLFVLAGEPSGDLIGASLMRDLHARVDVSLFGVGGPEMSDAGLQRYFDISELMVMGFADVIKQLPRLLARVKSTALHIVEQNPDAVLLVDYQEFSTLLAKRLRKLGYSGPVILCVAPSVWAWRPGRAKKLHGVFDEILAVLPFEPKVMADLGGPATSYIGHPAVGKFPVHEPHRTGPLLLLPGSRRGEIRRHMKVFGAVASRLASNKSITGFVLPTLPKLEKSVLAEVEKWPVDVQVVVDKAEQEAAYAQGVAALASSGTVTLELALRGIPHVGTYVPDIVQALSYLVAGRPQILLPNVIAGREVVPEELFGPRMSERIVNALVPLVEDGVARQAQISAFNEVRELMENGTDSAKKQDAADRILSYFT